MSEIHDPHLPKNSDKIVIHEVEKFFKEHEIYHIQSQFIGRIVTLIIASLGLITALAWDEMLRAIFARIVPDSDGLGAKILYAFVITLLATIVSVILGRLFLKRQKNRLTK